MEVKNQLHFCRDPIDILPPGTAASGKREAKFVERNLSRLVDTESVHGV